MSRRSGLALALCGLLLLAAGCSSDKTDKPAPLADIHSPVGVQRIWRLSLPRSEGYVQPALADDALYVAGGRTLMRVDPHTGVQTWKIETPAPISAGVGSDGSAVVVATNRGEVLCYEPGGKLRWQAQASSDVIDAPKVVAGTVVVRSTDHHIQAFDGANGKRLWVYQRQVPALALRAPEPLSFSDGSLMAGFAGGHLVGLALNNGAPRWDAVVSEPAGSTEVERLADVVGTLFTDSGVVCAASYQGRVGCFDAFNGNLRWARSMAAGAGVGGDSQRIYAVDADSAVEALSREAGASVWRNKRLAFRALSSPLAVGKFVAVGDFKGYVHLLDAANGDLAGRVDTDGTAIEAPLQLVGDSFLVQTRGGTIELLHPGK